MINHEPALFHTLLHCLGVNGKNYRSELLWEVSYSKSKHIVMKRCSDK